MIEDGVDAAHLAQTPLEELEIAEEEKTLESEDFDGRNFPRLLVGANVLVNVSVPDPAQGANVRSLNAVNDLENGKTDADLRR